MRILNYLTLFFAPFLRSVDSEEYAKMKAVKAIEEFLDTFNWGGVINFRLAQSGVHCVFEQGTIFYLRLNLNVPTLSFSDEQKAFMMDKDIKESDLITLREKFRVLEYYTRFGLIMDAGYKYSRSRGLESLGYEH